MANVAEKLDRQPAPGEIIDGQFVGVPTYYRVDHVRAIRAMARAAAHLTVDVGHKRARKTVARMNQIVKRLAHEAAKIGASISVHLGGLSGRPDAYRIGSGALCASIWITVGNRIVHEVAIEVSASMCMWTDRTGLGIEPAPAFAPRIWKRVDVTMRRLRKSSLVAVAA
jgi:hypothetical protein